MSDSFHDARLTEHRNPRTAAIDVAAPLAIVDLIGAEDSGVPPAVARARLELAKAIELLEVAFRAGGRLVYVGAGTSGRLGVLDAAECPPTFGTPPDMVIAVIAGGTQALVRPLQGPQCHRNAGNPRSDRPALGAPGQAAPAHGRSSRSRRQPREPLGLVPAPGRSPP